MSYPLRSIAGIGPAMAAQVEGARQFGPPKSCSKRRRPSKTARILAEKLGVDEQTVLRWANLADRMRIKGVREPYAELLKDAGVDTVRELKYRNPGRLAEAMAAANAKRKRVRPVAVRKARRALDRGRQEADAEDHLLAALDLPRCAAAKRRHGAVEFHHAKRHGARAGCSASGVRW